MNPLLEKHLPRWKVRFPETDADKKKVLAFLRRQYGGYTRPILDNCKEAFDSCTMMVIVNNKVRELQRLSSIGEKPNQETSEKTIANFHCTIAHKGFTLQEARWLLDESDNRLYTAIGAALVKI